MSKESVYFIAKPVTGNHDMKKIKKGLDLLPGVKNVIVNTKNGLVGVDYDSSGVSYDKIENQLTKLGYEISADAGNILSN